MVRNINVINMNRIAPVSVFILCHSQYGSFQSIKILQFIAFRTNLHNFIEFE